MKKKILLLNFPGENLYIRDYYCSKVSKADYMNAPIDLVMQSGRLNTGDYELKLIDALIDKKTPEQTLAEVSEYDPQIIIGLIGSVSLVEDKAFLLKLLEATDAEVFLTGDVLQTEGEKFLNEYPKLTGVITNFITNGIDDYLKGDKSRIQSLILREGDRIVTYPNYVAKSFEISTPIHDQFMKKAYRMPFVRRYPFATTLMTYGCPFRCSFCIMSTLGYKERPLENILSELDHLHALGVKEILFLDQTLGINKVNFKKLLEEMIARKYGFGWFGFSRVDIMDRDTMILAKRAGCHTLWFGIESGNQFILDTYRKGYTLEQIRKGFKNAKEAGIKTLATFILGLPEETYEMALETIAFAKEIEPDYASFNFAVPRYGTELREEAQGKGLIEGDVEVMDQSGSEIAMPSAHMTKQQIMKLKRKAVYGFYLRPYYVFKRLFALRSFTELVGNFRSAKDLILSTIGKGS